MHELLEKYFEGLTTLTEEEILRNYFNSQEVDAGLLPYKPLFQYFIKEKQAQLPDDFEKKLLVGVAQPGNVVRFNFLRKRGMQIAAVFALLVASWMILKQPGIGEQQAINWEEYETTDPDLAYEQTRAALMLLSSKLSNGAEKTVREISKAEAVSRFLQ